MRVTPRLAGLVAFCSVVCAGPVLQAQAPTLSDVLARAAEYHATYVTKVSGVSLEEHVNLMDAAGGAGHYNVRITSDVVLVNAGGQVHALRDPFAVDTRPTRAREPRILRLLGAPATPSIKDWQTAIALPQQGAHHFLLDIVVKVNKPTLALQFIAAANQPNLKYKLEGRKTMNRVPVVGVRFEEPAKHDTQYLLGTRTNARATGRFWIDPATGAIHQTELWVESKWETAMVSVKYAPHQALGLLLPFEMNDTYEEREGGGGPHRLGQGNDPGDTNTTHRSLQSRATYTNVTYAPIDLTKLGRGERKGNRAIQHEAAHSFPTTLLPHGQASPGLQPSRDTDRHFLMDPHGTSW